MENFEVPELQEVDSYEMSNGNSGPTVGECPPGCDATAAGSGWCAN